MTDHPGISAESTRALKRIIDAGIDLAAAADRGEEPDGPAVVAWLTAQRDDASAVRIELEGAADRGETDVYRQLRTCLRMLEAANDVCIYAWHGGDRGYDVPEWVALSSKAWRDISQLIADNIERRP